MTKHKKNMIDTLKIEINTLIVNTEKLIKKNIKEGLKTKNISNYYYRVAKLQNIVIYLYETEKDVEY